MWWMKPSKLVLFVLIPVFLVCVYLPSELVLRTHAKFYCITDEIRVLGLCALGAFAIGAMFTEGGRRWNSSGLSGEDVDRAIEPDTLYKLFVAASALTLVGYALLFLPIAGNLGAYVHALAGSFSEENGLKNEIRGSAAAGSSLMGVQSIASAMWALGFFADEKRFRSGLPLLLILSLSSLCFLRVLLVSERLALVEFALPVAMIFIAADRKQRFIYKCFPFVAITFLIVFFGFFEYFRSWKAVQATGVSFPEFCLERFVDYYVTAINNGALLYQRGTPDHLFRHAFSGIFDFAIFRTSSLSNDGWRLEYFKLLKSYLSLQFNNPSGIYPLFLDFGPVKGVFVFFLLGAIIGRISRSFGLRRWPGLVIYPVLFTGIWDLLRTFEWGDGSFLVPFAGCVALLAFGTRARPALYGSAVKWGGLSRRAPLGSRWPAERDSEGGVHKPNGVRVAGVLVPKGGRRA